MRRLKLGQAKISTHIGDPTAARSGLALMLNFLLLLASCAMKGKLTECMVTGISPMNAAFPDATERNQAKDFLVDGT